MGVLPTRLCRSGATCGLDRSQDPVVGRARSTDVRPPGTGPNGPRRPPDWSILRVCRRPPPSPLDGGRRGRGLGDIRRTLPVALLRAAHPRQALLTAAVLAGGAAMAGRSLRGGRPGRRHGPGRPGDPRLAQRRRRRAARPRPRPPRQADRPRPASTGARSPTPSPCAVLLVVPLSIANGIEAGLTHLAHPRDRAAHQRRAAATQPVLLPAVDGDVRPVPGVPVVRRVGRRGCRRTAHDRAHRAGGAARHRRARAALAARAWSTTTRTA